MYSEGDLVHKKEKLYFGILVGTSILTYLFLILSISGIIFLIAIVAVYWFLHNLAMVSIRKNGVRISEQQFPQFYNKAVDVARQMNLATVPDIYVIQTGGALNAFAAKFRMKNMVVLYAEVFELIEQQGEQEVLYILAHEFAHVKRKHVRYGWLLMPGLMWPFLGSAYSRACEFTCDRYGAYYCASHTAAKNALTILAIGPQLYKKVDQEVFMQQASEEVGFLSWFEEKTSTHPNLPRRMNAIEAFFSSANGREVSSSTMEPSHFID